MFSLSWIINCRKMYKLVKEKCKTKHVWVGKFIHRESCKKFEFDHMNKWCMHNKESVLENETHKLL